MNNADLVQRAQSVLFQNYRTQPIALVRGEGSWVTDADGKRYLDFIGGIATVSVGHANPRVRDALMKQAGLLWHASNLYVTEPQITLAEKLTAQTKTCAVMTGPIQGEAGVLSRPRGYLARVRELCTRHGALLLLDEVQTGMGRTGAFFAHQHERIEPDAMSLAKGIAGGIPLGALLAREEVARAFTPGTHASTFGGNPPATAA